MLGSILVNQTAWSPASQAIQTRFEKLKYIKLVGLLQWPFSILFFLKAYYKMEPKIISKFKHQVANNLRTYFFVLLAIKVGLGGFLFWWLMEPATATKLGVSDLWILPPCVILQCFANSVVAGLIFRQICDPLVPDYFLDRKQMTKVLYWLGLCLGLVGSQQFYCLTKSKDHSTVLLWSSAGQAALAVLIVLLYNQPRQTDLVHLSNIPKNSYVRRFSPERSPVDTNFNDTLNEHLLPRDLQEKLHATARTIRLKQASKSSQFRSSFIFTSSMMILPMLIFCYME